jgi:glycogen operon protein
MTVGPVIEYLKSLGITAIEFLPIHAFVTGPHLVEKHLVNYWGYDSIGFFAPEPAYLATGLIAEFKTMVARFHDAGIEVILDVVYNHTGEGNQLGPTLSFRGIDNASYYRLAAEPRFYVDVTGTGNSLDLTHPRVLQMVMDSLRYWVSEMHVDGFRFDLSVTLAREQNGFDAGSGFLDAIRQDPTLAHAKLIAEPWDIAPDGYQLGNHGPPWAEWNDRYRDTVRRFWRGDEGVLPELAARITGSADLFDHDGRRPWASVNFVTAHDGFTLRDLASYNQKHNEANGEENRDGQSENYSINHGAEGPTDDLTIRKARLRYRRNMLATLLFSQGTPMLLGGDEFGRSQNGNNNPYCQDNEISWLDWNIGPEEKRFVAFVERLISLRRAHPVLRSARFLHSLYESADGIRDITWIAPEGTEMRPEQWQDPSAHCVGMMLNGKAGVSPWENDGSTAGDLLMIILNGGAAEVEFRLPDAPPSRGDAWKLLLDTAERFPSDGIIRCKETIGAPERSITLWSLVHIDTFTES